MLSKRMEGGKHVVGPDDGWTGVWSSMRTVRLSGESTATEVKPEITYGDVMRFMFMK
jgi:hypothetical protein